MPSKDVRLFVTDSVFQILKLNFLWSWFDFDQFISGVFIFQIELSYFLLNLVTDKHGHSLVYTEIMV